MLHSITHARVATVPIRGARRLARRGVGVAWPRGSHAACGTRAAPCWSCLPLAP